MMGVICSSGREIVANLTAWAGSIVDADAPDADDAAPADEEDAMEGFREGEGEGGKEGGGWNSVTAAVTSSLRMKFRRATT